MQIIHTKFPEVKILAPTIFNDHRGFFLEVFHQKKFERFLDREIHFVQENVSHSKKGVLRGLHYQLPPSAQAKLVQVIHGEILDVVVDVRKNSENFGKWFSVHVTAENKRQIWIPEGFAHGLLVLSDVAEILYRCTDYWDEERERCILWNDPALGIDWLDTIEPILSEKDTKGVFLKDVEVYE